MIYHTIYKTTNLVNNKFYIGKHSTKNPYDGYIGSGKTLIKAIQKYGKHSFRKDVMFIYENQQDAFDKEKELVNSGVLDDPDCYNLCIGGIGGNFLQRKNKTYTQIYGDKAADIADKISKSKLDELNPMYGKTHSTQTRERMSEVAKQQQRLTGEHHKKAIQARSEKHRAGELVYGMEGKSHKEESKKKTSASLTGKRWWHNEHGNRLRSYECPGDGWTLGSGPKKRQKEIESLCIIVSPKKIVDIIKNT